MKNADEIAAAIIDGCRDTVVDSYGRPPTLKKRIALHIRTAQMEAWNEGWEEAMKEAARWAIYYGPDNARFVDLAAKLRSLKHLVSQ